MRRSLAAALLGISLWIGSLAWSGFLMTRTVLDPSRSERVAETLLENEAVRAQLVDNIAGAIEAGLPPGAPVDRAALEVGAEQALDSPAVRTLVLDAFVRSHQAFLGEGDPPRSIDGGAFGAAARQAVIDRNPALAGVVPEAPSIEVPLPTKRIPDLGPVRRGLLTAVPILAGAAVVGAALALLVTTNRPAVIRRAGFWAIGLSAVVLVFAYGVPALAQEVAPSQAEVVAALVAALAESTRGPALALAGAGVAGIVLSLLWRPAASAMATDGNPPPARAAAPAPRRAREVGRPRPPRRDLPTPARRPAPTRAAPASPPVPPTASAPSAGGPVPAPNDRSDATRVQPAATDATRVERAVPADASPAPSAHSRSAPPSNARWVNGVGWVHEGPGAIPETARWVPGVGYVLED